MSLRSSKIFENSFLKNGFLEFWTKVLIVSILTYPFNDNQVHNKNYDYFIFSKIVITNFRQKLQKIFIFVLQENSYDERALKKSKN